ncbi:MAG TPA: plastocyanin/azurin family copper-binding protein [Acidimicrobiales bacterium]|nr:plastocyanin/azurin family copper-binding protein [Acidimicrobiales bacterium]
MNRIISAVLATALLAAVASSPTPAGPLDQRIVAAAFQFVPAETTISRGQLLEFTNLDVAPHNLIALRLGRGGKPAFRTDTIGAGTTVVLEGLDKLPPGVYDYTCTLHPAMLGTIFLEEAGG